MKMNRRLTSRKLLIVPLLILLLAIGGATSFLFASCGPFTDVGSLICPFVLELYYSGITAGTTATTFSPNDPVTRGQMAVFTSTALDLSLARSSRRAALGQWWIPTPHYDAGLGLTTVGFNPSLLKSDGADVWVANNGDGTVSRVRASDGMLLGTWTGASGAFGVLLATGRVFVTGDGIPGSLYMIDPTQPPGAVTTISSSLGNTAAGIAFDGSNIWTANLGGSVSKITPGTSPGSWTISMFTTGFTAPEAAIFAGGNVWITDSSQFVLMKLNSDGSIAQSVPVGPSPTHPAFDGENIWVPNEGDSSLTVVRVSDGTVLQTLTGNGLNTPFELAFDGQRIIATNRAGGLSLFKAADLSVIGNVPTPGMGEPFGVASDGVNFWITDAFLNTIGRF